MKIGGDANTAGGGGGGGSAELLSLYGDGSLGDYTSQTDGEEWNVVGGYAFGGPGDTFPYPALPAGVAIDSAFFDNLTIAAGHHVAVGGLGPSGDAAIVIFVNGTLTIEAGGSLHANGGNAGNSTLVSEGNYAGGRRAIPGSSNGGDSGYSLKGPADGRFGTASGNQPAFAWATMNNTAGGKGGSSTGAAAHVGGDMHQSTTVSWPDSLAHALSIAALMYVIGGGNGGGGGGAATTGDVSGPGGGGGGTLVIFARNIVAPAGSIQAKGGHGGNAFSSAPDADHNAGGGGGGCGGTILIVTEETSIAGLCDVSGGAGGLPAGPGTAGAAGNPGVVLAFNPSLGAI